MNIDIFKSNINTEDYILVKYYLEASDNLKNASWNLAIGQSVGNPNVRNKWETDDLFEKYSCVILHDENELCNIQSGIVTIAFPIINIDFSTDGVSHLLVNIMGGQLDIDNILKCHVLDIIFPDKVRKEFLGPKFGISGIRKFVNVYDKPLLGAIVKPKTGISPSTLLDMVKELVDGGVNFIKEDEILSSPNFCSLKDRVPLLTKYLRDKNIVYAFSIHADHHHILERVKYIYENGGNGVHINFWCGMGVYNSVRSLDLPVFVHFQKSGDKILTNKNHDFHIDWRVICKLAGMMGVDFIHAGMIGGYYKWDEQETIDAVRILNSYNVMPALSCGFHPGLTDWVTSKVGNDYMANVGGAIHGHPNGTLSGVKAMRQSIDHNYGIEYQEAINKWGKV
jgi:ribulose-bisphosphate carboxylase large chain